MELCEIFSSDDLKNGLAEKDQFIDTFTPLISDILKDSNTSALYEGIFYFYKKIRAEMCIDILEKFYGAQAKYALYITSDM